MHLHVLVTIENESHPMFSLSVTYLCSNVRAKEDSTTPTHLRLTGYCVRYLFSLVQILCRATSVTRSSKYERRTHRAIFCLMR